MTAILWIRKLKTGDSPQQKRQGGFDLVLTACSQQHTDLFSSPHPAPPTSCIPSIYLLPRVPGALPQGQFNLHLAPPLAPPPASVSSLNFPTLSGKAKCLGDASSHLLSTRKVKKKKKFSLAIRLKKYVIQKI